MKPKTFAFATGATMIALGFYSPLSAAVTVDGVRNVAESYVEQAVQQTTTAWGADNALANLNAVQNNNDLFVHLAAKATDNAIIIFIDSKAGGINFIANNTIASGGEEFTINSLGSSASAGMTFETGFLADYALRIYINGAGDEAFINRYDLQTGTRTYVGSSKQTTPALPVSGFVSSLKIDLSSIDPPFASITKGIEFGLNLPQLGVPSGGSQTVKMFAVLVNNNSSFGSNQVLASRTADTTVIGSAINSINFQTEPGTQTLSLTVSYNDTDGDGIPDNIDTDDDNDGLLDTVETNAGIYVSPANTGSNPLVADTDGDGRKDGPEVTGAALGYVSNPNVKNFLTMAVPGTYTFPEWQVDGSASNAMTQGATSSITAQYDWTLNYRFTFDDYVPVIEYKYAADGSYTNSWGNGSNNFAVPFSATGFYRFQFNNQTLAQSLTRIVYPNVAAYLAAYGLTSGSDADGDGLNNEAEFAANTDPTEADTDLDGTPDNSDASPLSAVRDVLFSVDMSIVQAQGNFNPAVDGVVVDFFNGILGSLPDLVLSDPNTDGVWTGTLANVNAPLGAPSGGYKFKNTRPGAADNGYEGAITNRTFLFAVPNTVQTLPTVFFNNVTTASSGYQTWSAANAGGQGPNLDFDGDGVANAIEYFMGETGSTKTINPLPVANVVSWKRNPAATVTGYKVWYSTNLNTWTDVTASADISDSNFVKYTLPVSDPKRFIRLEVTVP